MKILRTVALAAILPLAACTQGFVASGLNTADLDEVDFSQVDQLRRGESCATTLLGLITEGEALITEAARDGGISQVEVVEHKVENKIIFFKQCVIVFGR